MGIRIQQYGRGPRNVGIGGVDAGFQPTLRGVNGTEGQQVLGTLLGVGAKLTDVAVREFVSSETARVSQSLQQMNEELAAESSRYMSEHQGENALDAGAHFDRFARETAQKHLEEGGFQGRFAEQFQRQAAGEVLRFREQGEAYGAQQKAAWTNAVYQGSVQENLNGIAKNYNNPEYIEFSLANMDELVDGFFPGMDNRARKTAFREEAAGRIVEGYLADGNIDGARGALDRYRDLLGKQGDTFERAIRGRETLVAERERKERPVREFNRIMAEKERLIQLSGNEAAGWQEARRLAAEVEDPEDRAAVMNMVMQEQNVGTRRRLASDMQKLMALSSGLSPAEQMEQLEAAGISAEGLQQVRTRLERGGATDPEAQRSGFMRLLWQAETALTDRESEETLLASAMQLGLDGEAARWVLKVRDGEYPGPQALSRALGAPVTDVALYLATCATLSQRGFNAENRPTESDLRSACAQAAGQLAMTYGGQNGTLVRASADVSLSDALLHGLQSSVSGLWWREKLPDVLKPEELQQLDIAQQFALSLGMMAGDIPTMAVGSLAGLSGNPAAASAAALGLTEGTRTWLEDNIRNGSPKDLKETLDRTKHVLTKAGKGAVVGGVTGGVGSRVAKTMNMAKAGPVARESAKVTSEMVTLPTVTAAVEGRLPEAADYADAAALILGMRVAGGAGNRFAQTMQTGASRLEERLRTIYRQTGITPDQIARDVKYDPELRKELIDLEKTIPEPFTAEGALAESSYQKALREIYSSDRSIKMTFKETGVKPSLVDRSQLRAYLDSLDSAEIKALKLTNPQDYLAVLKAIVRRFFPEKGELRFRRAEDGRALDYEHFVGRDIVRDEYLSTFLHTLKKQDILVEFTTSEGEAKAYLIRKFFDSNIQKDIWDMLVIRDGELKTKIARKEKKGRGYIESQIYRAGSEASQPTTAGGATESASTPRDVTKKE